MGEELATAIGLLSGILAVLLVLTIVLKVFNL